MLLNLTSTTNLVIALSGASHSGKTSFMEKTKEVLGEGSVVLISENIREEEIVKELGIEKIRKDPQKYFELQKTIIEKKWIQEQESAIKHKNKIILVDRSLADSIYYYTKYVEIENMSNELKNDYFKFLLKIQDVAQHTFSVIYNSVFVFPPIKKLDAEGDDVFRQDKSYFDASQEAEFAQIALLNEGLSSIVGCPHKIRAVTSMFQTKDNDWDITEDIWRAVCYRLIKQ